MSKLQVWLKHNGYPISIASGSLGQLGAHIKEIGTGGRTAIISDETVTRLYGDAVETFLRETDISCFWITVKDGESSKSLEQISRIYTRLLEDRFRRDSLIIALGGGVVGDLAGFVAATLMRGVPFIQVPTTLLSQVDSSVGGKVGVNHPLGKNLIGSFYQPRSVWIDPEVLTTLDSRDIYSGLGEIVKYALIGDGQLLGLIESRWDDIVKLSDSSLLADIIGRCCRIKARIVEEDEKEMGFRKILNFGHTLGHALEAATDFSLFRHGEAVVHGMKWAAYVSKEKKDLSEENYNRVTATLDRFDIPAMPGHIDASVLTEKILLDKKQSSKGLQIVLLNDIGQPVIESDYQTEKWIRNWMAYGNK